MIKATPDIDALLARLARLKTKNAILQKKVGH